MVVVRKHALGADNRQAWQCLWGRSFGNRSSSSGDAAVSTLRKRFTLYVCGLPASQFPRQIITFEMADEKCLDRVAEAFGFLPVANNGYFLVDTNRTF